MQQLWTTSHEQVLKAQKVEDIADAARAHVTVARKWVGIDKEILKRQKVKYVELPIFVQIRVAKIHKDAFISINGVVPTLFESDGGE